MRVIISAVTQIHVLKLLQYLPSFPRKRAKRSSKGPPRKHAYIILTPLKPYFYIVKLGITGAYIIFLISAQNIDSNGYPQSMFWAEIWKISEFASENFHFLVVKFSVYLNRRVFVMIKSFKMSKPVIRGKRRNIEYACITYLSHLITKPTKWLVRPGKAQITASAQSDYSLRCLPAKTWVLSYPMSAQPTQWAHSQDDLTGWMPRLICLRWAYMPFCWFCQ